MNTNTIGESIAALRKAKGMTQEELSITIGVTSQSVSKWETGATMPDIMLLPVIADIFGISTDELFGRNQSKTTDMNGLYMQLTDIILERMALYMGNDSKEAYEKYRNALKHDVNLQTGILNCKGGSVYYTEKTGAVLLADHDDGVFASEGTARLFERFSDEAFRKLISLFCAERKEHSQTAYTAASLAKKLCCGIEDIQKNLDFFETSGVLSPSEADIGDEKLKIYSISSFSRGRLHILEIISVYATAFSECQNNYYSWCG